MMLMFERFSARNLLSVLHERFSAKTQSVGAELRVVFVSGMA
jgi:hypothetical protein